MINILKVEYLIYKSFDRIENLVKFDVILIRFKYLITSLLFGGGILKRMFLIGLLILSIIVSGCSDQQISRSITSDSISEQDNDSLESREWNVENIAIRNSTFSPSSLTILEDTIVVWTNYDSEEHNIVSDVGSVDSGELSQGETFVYVFRESRTYRYHCSIHPSMKGTIIVEDD